MKVWALPWVLMATVLGRGAGHICGLLLSSPLARGPCQGTGLYHWGAGPRGSLSGRPASPQPCLPRPPPSPIGSVPAQPPSISKVAEAPRWQRPPCVGRSGTPWVPRTPPSVPIPLSNLETTNESTPPGEALPSVLVLGAPPPASRRGRNPIYPQLEEEPTGAGSGRQQGKGAGGLGLRGRTLSQGTPGCRCSRSCRPVRPGDIPGRAWSLLPGPPPRRPGHIQPPFHSKRQPF